MYKNEIVLPKKDDLITFKDGSTGAVTSVDVTVFVRTPDGVMHDVMLYDIEKIERHREIWRKQDDQA